MNLYERQKELKLNIPDKVAVVGCGGIGSWVSLSLALLGVKELILVDYDIVEETNLNRTPFRINDIGKYKVNAMFELIKERRPSCYVFPIENKVENALYLLERLKPSLIVDCRDNIKHSNYLRAMAKYVKLGYDGMEFTIDTYKQNIAFEEGEEIVRYQTVPSFVGIPLFLATWLVNYISINENFQEKITTKNIKEVVENV